MLLGQFTGKVDDKGRVPLPKRFRSELGETVIVTKGLDTHLLIVGEKDWQTLLEGTKDKPFTDKEAREIQRFLLGNAVSLATDEKGRIHVPQFLRTYAHITHDVVFAGIDRYVEVWDGAEWEKEQNRLAEQIDSVTERLRLRNDE